MIRGDIVTMDYGSLDHADFRALVAQDARGQATPEAAAFLRSEKGLQRWSDTLRELKKELEAQFGQRAADAQGFQNQCFAAGQEGKREWFEYKAQYDQWRAGARRFHASVQAKIKENKSLMKDSRAAGEGERYASERVLYRKMLNRTLAFLGEEEAITYRFWPARDELREEIEAVLYPFGR